MKPLLGMLGLSALAAGAPAVQPTALAPSTRVVRQDSAAPAQGWLNWRGPAQNGTSPETGLLESLALDGENHLWSYPMSGRGTPVVSNGRVFAQGYEGKGPGRQEVLLCLDEDTGERLWEYRTRDYLSDVIYNRYAIGSPTVDPETGNLFNLTGGGLLLAFTPDGEVLWERGLTEDLGRLSFPNGRTGAPLVFGDLVIMHFIFASWGPLGPARDRFFAFDKHTGEVVWSSTPGGPPKDSSFSMPALEFRDGRALLYAGLGGGHVTCIDARTGDPLWRFPLAIGGLNCSPVIYGDKLIAINGKENVDSSKIGRMIALDLTKLPGDDGVLGTEAELWRNDLVAFTSSPVLIRNRIYQTVLTGELVCVDADTGKELWHEKLAADQLHASPVAADGKLYVPMNDGSFHIVRPSDEGAEVLTSVQLEGNCLGAPAVANGRVYVHTTEKLYCFGSTEGEAPAWPVLADEGAPGDPARLQFVPADASFRVGDEVPFRVRSLDALGRRAGEVALSDIQMELPPFIQQNDAGHWTASQPGVATVKATSGALSGSARLRVVPALPYNEDFESVELTQGGDEPFGAAPGFWFGARPKWMVRSIDGSKVVVRKMDNPLFQRTISLFGHPDDSNYTFSADVRADGNRRAMGWVGVINQRYLIMLKGLSKELEVSSNMERIKVSVPFVSKPGTWYHLKTRVDVNDDGSGVVRAKAWPRGEAEPKAWTIEAEDPHVHTHGAAGVYGFTPQSRFTVYLDNLTVTPNE